MSDIFSAAQGYRENIPDPCKLLQALRYLDYSAGSALCDLTDNCFDAAADTVHLRLWGAEDTSPERIELWDNGTGANEQSLQEALRLGAGSLKDPHHQFGQYGMGLITASLSLGRRLTVTSLQKGRILRAVHDLDEICQTGRFLIRLFELDGPGKDHFLQSLQEAFPNKVLPLSGTCVTLEKTDRWVWSSKTAAEQALTHGFGQVYRKILQAGREIFINHHRVTPYDPVCPSETLSTLLSEKTFQITPTDQITVRLFACSPLSPPAEQGFYLLRNQREIAVGQTFGLFQKSETYQRFRGEFSYPGNLDALVMNVTSLVKSGEFSYPAAPDSDKEGGFSKKNGQAALAADLRAAIEAFVRPYLTKFERQEI